MVNPRIRSPQAKIPVAFFKRMDTCDDTIPVVGYMLDVDGWRKVSALSNLKHGAAAGIRTRVPGCFLYLQWEAGVIDQAARHT